MTQEVTPTLRSGITSKFSSAKSVFSACYKIWRDMIFPPFCMSCGEPCETKLFCPDCWELCSPPDPAQKCPHCFEDSEGLCNRCRKAPLLPFSQAYVFDDVEPARLLVRQPSDIVAAFAMRSWIALDWLTPDVILPMPGSGEIALAFSEMIERPLAHLFAGNRDGHCDVEAINADQIILVIGEGGSLQEYKHAVKALSAAEPKRGYLLSLFQMRE